MQVNLILLCSYCFTKHPCRGTKELMNRELFYPDHNIDELLQKAHHIAMLWVSCPPLYFLWGRSIVHSSSLPFTAISCEPSGIFAWHIYLSLPSLPWVPFSSWVSEWEKGSLDDTALRATDDDIAVQQVRNWFLQGASNVVNHWQRFPSSSIWLKIMKI